MNLWWLDIETSGLNPYADSILEIAIAKTTLEDPFSLRDIRQYTLHFLSHKVRAIGPYVREIHTKNGLWAECARSDLGLHAMQEELLDLIPAPASKENEPVLAGSSVHFDHGFLKVHTPKLAARFSHRYYDVSAIKLFCRSLGMEKLPRAEAHRAMADIEESIAHAKACIEWLRNRFDLR